jgi:ankyrin repeat protein
MDLNVVRSFVESGADIHAGDDFALRYAAGNGHLNTVQYLVENGADIHANNDYALWWSAMNRHLDVVRFLMENGADMSYLLDTEGNPTEITNRVLTEDQIKEAKQLFAVRKVMTD